MTSIRKLLLAFTLHSEVLVTCQICEFILFVAFIRHARGWITSFVAYECWEWISAQRMDW